MGLVVPHPPDHKLGNGVKRQLRRFAAEDVSHRHLRYTTHPHKEVPSVKRSPLTAFALSGILLTCHQLLNHVTLYAVRVLIQVELNTVDLQWLRDGDQRMADTFPA